MAAPNNIGTAQAPRLVARHATLKDETPELGGNAGFKDQSTADSRDCADKAQGKTSAAACRPSAPVLNCVERAARAALRLLALTIDIALVAAVLAMLAVLVLGRAAA